jgi:transcription antitermination protein NusB
MSDDRQHSPELNDEPLDVVCTELTLTEQRSLIFHVLYVVYAYEYDISLEAVADTFKRGYGVEIPPDSFVFTTADSIVKERDQLDKEIVPLIENWRFDRLGVATTLILRLALWELSHTDTDKAVIINEAIELAKCFGEKDSFKFINGVLDKYIKRDGAESL